MVTFSSFQTTYNFKWNVCKYVGSLQFGASILETARVVKCSETSLSPQVVYPFELSIVHLCNLLAGHERLLFYHWLFWKFLIDMRWISWLIKRVRVICWHCRLDLHGGFGLMQFYFPHGPPPSKDTTESCMARINQIFGAHPEGLPASGQSSQMEFWLDLLSTRSE